MSEIADSISAAAHAIFSDPKRVLRLPAHEQETTSRTVLRGSKAFFKMLSSSSRHQTADWSHRVLEMEMCWQEHGVRGRGVKVAILDTGADQTHEDLEGAIEDGADFTNSRFGWADLHGHGTHCAGVVAARDNNVGIIGAAPDANLLIGKVLGDDGSGTLEGIAAGIDWAVSKSADVISMSLGGDGPISGIIRTAIDKAIASGAIVVVAAGNSGVPSYPQPRHRRQAMAAPARPRCGGGEDGGWCGGGGGGGEDGGGGGGGGFYDGGPSPPFGGGGADDGGGGGGGGNVGSPGNYNPCVTVGACGSDFVVAPFSSRGPEIDIVAPGVDIVSCVPGQRYTAMSGTSMATPMVAGIAALFVEKCLSGGGEIIVPRDRRQRAFENYARTTARDMGTPGFDTDYGCGVIQPRALLSAFIRDVEIARRPPVPAPTPTPEDPPAAPPPAAPGSGGGGGIVSVALTLIGGKAIVVSGVCGMDVHPQK